MTLPDGFLQRMKSRLGEEFPAFFNSYGQPALRGLRVNALKIGAEEFLRRAPFPLGDRIEWEPNGFYLTQEKAGGDPYHFAGLYYLQEPSAMCAVPLLAEGLPAGARVLDLCAAPGGKTTQIASAMGGDGILVSNEVDFSRAKILAENVVRSGIKNCAVTSADAGALAQRFPDYFDAVLVDAPCSGEGMFRKEPSAVASWSAENVAGCALRQRAILDNAADMVRCGGTLVYSTCTFAEEEDEIQVDEFLKRRPDFTLERTVKLYPHRVAGEGHFAARFKRTGGGVREAKPFPIKQNGAAQRVFSAFCKGFMKEPETPVCVLADGRVYLIPQGLPALNVRTLLAGVRAGEWDGKLFKPAHALAVSYPSRDFYNYLSLSREECLAYLHGEQLSATLNGWCVVGVEEFPLGLGKGSGGAVKNHFPKSLRLRDF